MFKTFCPLLYDKKCNLLMTPLTYIALYSNFGLIFYEKLPQNKICGKNIFFLRHFMGNIYAPNHLDNRGLMDDGWLQVATSRVIGCNVARFSSKANNARSSTPPPSLLDNSTLISLITQRAGILVLTSLTVLTILASVMAVVSPTQIYIYYVRRMG